MSVFDFNDFRGGYMTDVPTDLMKDNELLQADNCYWRNGLKQRLGKASVVSLTGSAIRGGIRTKVAGNWYTFLGVDTTAAGAVELKYGTATAFTTLTMPSGTAYTLQTGYDVQFAVLDERVVAVNGYDKPTVIWNSATTAFQTETLERYDLRTMASADWNAGQYYPSLSATMYMTDTSDAQSAASQDFAFATYSVTSGFWVACAHTFNKVTLYDAKANATGSMTFEYYGRASSGAATGWTSFTPINTPTWTAAENKEIEMNFPIDANTNELLMEKVASLNSSIGGVFAMRFTNANTIDSTTAWACANIKLEHSQYLTQILLNDRPDTVATHKSHLILGAGNWMHISPYSTVKGWREADKEYFSEGGLVQQMVPQLDYLAILLDNAIYGLYGNSWQNWSTKLLVSRGTIGKRTAAVVNEEVYFVSRDGIYGWNGSRLLKLSKHIKSDIDSYTKTNAAAAQINGEYWVSFPSNAITETFDPDTLRIDDVGDGRVSFYKFTGYQVDQFIPYTGALDTGALMAIVNTGSQARLDQLETANYDKISASATIPYVFRTRDIPFEKSQQAKVFRRLKIQAAQATATAGAGYRLVHHAFRSDGAATYSASFAVSVGSDIYTTYLGIPPGIEGYTYGLSVSHDTQYDANFFGFSVDVEKRSY